MAVFIIAEAGVNHNGEIKLALELAKAAKDAGADAVKFQTFRTSKLVTRSTEKASYQKKNTGGNEKQYDMLRKLELSYEDHKSLKEFCDNIGIKFLSTPFDFESVDLLESLNVPIYKISSGDLNNLPFIKYIAEKKKPVIISTGMSYLGEIEEAINTVYSANNKEVSVLHCTTNYPTPYKDVNLNAMITIKQAFNIPVGYSDHTSGIEIPIAAVAIGAQIIEKHFTLDCTLPGPDHAASIEPESLRSMVKSIRAVEIALGNGIKEPCPEELEIMRAARKSIVTASKIKAGQVITRERLELKRPGTGLPPKYLALVLNRIAARDLPEEHLIQIGDFI